MINEENLGGRQDGAQPVKRKRISTSNKSNESTAPIRSSDDSQDKKPLYSSDREARKGPRDDYGNEFKENYRRDPGNERTPRYSAPRDYNRDDREERNFNRDDRGERNFNRDDRGERNFNRDDRGERNYNRDDRGERNFNRDDRGERNFNRDDRGERNYNRDDRNNGYGRTQGYNRNPGYGRDSGYDRNSGYNRGERSDRGGSYDRQGGGRSYGNDRGSGYDRGQSKSYGRKPYGGQSQGSDPRRSYGNRDGRSDNRSGGRPYNKSQQRPSSNDYSRSRQPNYNIDDMPAGVPVRLNKFIANTGLCSRREADTYIETGLITVNGALITELGTKVLPSDEIRYNGERLQREKKVYILLNKPKDYVTSVDDPHAKRTVMELIIGACRERIYPVGRLDRMTTGVLLLTNDGELTKKLTHPTSNIRKIYQVMVDKNVKVEDMNAMLEGITLDDGFIKFDGIEYTSDTDKNLVGIEIHSGRNRIVRRVFEHFGYKVVKLDRIFFAGLTKKGLQRGKWRYLAPNEVGFLKMMKS